uniref:Putative cytochrome oxidase c assembly n=1 Tax=Nyssomyia neivai TaxID=330878 RepID=A0A1L8DZV1_9DIPT
MRKVPKRDMLFDKLHRGVVWTCMGITVYGTYLLGVRVYRYFTVIRPAQQQRELEMLKENAQPSAAMLDKIPELKG